MTRLFQRHIKRNSTLLDGMWRFKTDPDKSGIQRQWHTTIPEDAAPMFVPSCWNNELGLYDYEGTAWYFHTFRTTGKNVNIIFHAVTGQAEVYLDGKHLGGHYGGFTPFNFVMADLDSGEHILAVSVDNTHDSMNTIPLANVDWLHYGGIIRSVELMELSDVWIKDYRIDYTMDEGLENADLSCEITLEGLGSGIYQRRFSFYLDNSEIYTSDISINGLQKLFVRKCIKGIKLWDIGLPNLYTARFEIEDDDISERIGFRKITAENRKIMLNGREISLKGINRHEDHPDWGFAFPQKLMKKDIEIIRDMGCNTVRGSHYPNSEAFIDYLDQEGLLFWEEIPMWGYPEKPLENPLVLERGLFMHEEMIKRDYHHPSIIIWGLHNEIDTSSTAAYDLTKSFACRIRELDPTRLLTFASDRPLTDICFPLVDIVSVNKYFGWYEGAIESWDRFLVQLKEKLEQDGLRHLPIIISEFGAAAIYGDCTFESPKWTENYQDELLCYTLRLFGSDPDIAGTYIWQFCDTRTSKQLEMGRARSFNNKGVVNEYRKPKLSYWTVKRAYEGQNGKFD